MVYESFDWFCWANWGLLVIVETDDGLDGSSRDGLRSSVKACVELFIGGDLDLCGPSSSTAKYGV